MDSNALATASPPAACEAPVRVSLWRRLWAKLPSPALIAQHLARTRQARRDEMALRRLSPRLLRDLGLEAGLDEHPDLRRRPLP